MTNTHWWRDSSVGRWSWTWQDANQVEHQGAWWQNAVIYQINPLSFLDTDGDGKGDLAGVTEKLDYLAALGVDAIWLCPIFASPMNDLGYDITDMRRIDPTFGSVETFDRLVAVAHAIGLKVIIDQVWSHTSDKHPWFLESRQSQDNARADWYVWAEPKPDGSPPNNWLSAFTGQSAWRWAPERRQFYFYNFLPSQPDLNWHNPAVVEAILKRAQFWLDRGIDGFRIDAPNFFLHDPELRDNPPRPADTPHPEGVDAENPMVRQLFKYNFCRPETLEALKPIRELVDQYPAVVTLGEVTLCDDSVALASEYVHGDQRFHLAYHSALLAEEPISAALMRRTLKRTIEHFREGGCCWIVGNHDYGRLRSRWTGADASGNPYPETFYRMMAALLLSLPGAFCLYQGDELGLPEATIPDDIPVEDIQDPFGQALYPAIHGRDGSRTPMPWQGEAPNAGFSTAEKTWLPVPEDHYAYAVDVQERHPQSLLNTWRRLLHWRRKQPALLAGDIHLLETEDPLFGFIRQYGGQRLVCLYNLSHAPVSYEMPETLAGCKPVQGLGFETERRGQVLKLPEYGAFLGNLPLQKTQSQQESNGQSQLVAQRRHLSNLPA
ncbi:MAG: alpha-glucosidase [Leptolyngbya sp. SIO4C1]|nr:alpha-glucosidase [Leptolyngbya sp. SIO4C1]